MALSRPFDSTNRQARAFQIILSGLATGVVGQLGFALAHAVIIVPIWTRPVGGAPLAILAGIGLAWAFDVLDRYKARDENLVLVVSAVAVLGAHGAPAREWSGAWGPRERPSRGPGQSPGLVRSGRSQTVASGVQFGAVMFLTLMPATALEAALSVSGLRTGGWMEAVAAIVLAVSAGAAAGWLLTRRHDVLLPFSFATVALMFASAGPLPVTQSARGFWLAVSILPICLVSEAALASLRAVLDLPPPRSGAMGPPRSVSGGQGPPE